MRGLLLILVLLVAVAEAGLADHRPGHMRQPGRGIGKIPPDFQVAGIKYCAGRYRVRVKSGKTREFQEYNLSFKTDSGRDGPKPGQPVMFEAGYMGDRVTILFHDAMELAAAIKTVC